MLNEIDQSIIVEDFNSETMSVPQMAEKYGIVQGKLKSKIVRLQKQGIIGKKNKVGKIITPPEKYTGPKKKKLSLGEMLNGIKPNEVEDISILHKEMLVEILHRIIVK